MRWFKAQEVSYRDIARYVGVDESRVSKWGRGVVPIPAERYDQLLRLYLRMQHLRTTGQNQRAALEPVPTLLGEVPASQREGQVVLDDPLYTLMREAIQQQDAWLMTRTTLVAAARGLVWLALQEPRTLVLKPVEVIQLSAMASRLQELLRRVMEHDIQQYHEEYFGTEDTDHGPGCDAEAADGHPVHGEAGLRLDESHV
jgi:hypothetical protein